MESNVYRNLELLRQLADYKKIDYEIAELKDGLIVRIKNVKIPEVDLTKNYEYPPK